MHKVAQIVQPQRLRDGTKKGVSHIFLQLHVPGTGSALTPGHVRARSWSGRQAGALGSCSPAQTGAPRPRSRRLSLPLSGCTPTLCLCLLQRHGVPMPPVRALSPAATPSWFPAPPTPGNLPPRLRPTAGFSVPAPQSQGRPARPPSSGCPHVVSTPAVQTGAWPTGTGERDSLTVSKPHKSFINDQGKRWSL